MSKGGGSTTTVEKNEPWAAQKPYLEYGFSEGLNQYQNFRPDYYPGQTYAPQSQETLAGLNAQTQRALNGSSVVDAAKGAVTDIASGSQYNPAMNLYSFLGLPNSNPTLASTASGAFLHSNPYLDATYDKIANKIVGQYQTATAPDINSSAISAGRYGSPTWQRLKLGAQATLGETLANAATDVYGGNYQSERDRMLNAANSIQDAQLRAAAGLGSTYNSDIGNRLQASMFAPDLAANDYKDIQALQQVGAQRDAYNQGIINDAMSRWDFYQQQPYNQLARYLGLIQGNYGGTATSTAPNTSNPWATAAGGAASGAAAGSAFGPWGTAIGAGVGLLGGMM